MKKILLLITVALLIGLAFWKTQNTNNPRLEQQQRYMMDTYVTIFADGPKNITSRAIDHAFGKMQEVATKFDAHNPKSPLYAFNHQATPITDPELLKVIRSALDISQKTEGAFDITVYPLLELWGFYKHSPQMPKEEEIRACLNRIGYQHLLLTDKELKANRENIAIDLGGIAKGYAIAKGIEVLKQEGITSALIDAGGDIYALGTKRGKPWRVGLQHPRKVGLLGYIEVTNTAVMGSGDYRRFFMKKSKRYHHIFNPKTGYPADELSEITVIYPEPALADAWATALFVLGPEKGLKIAEGVDGLEAVMVTSEGKILYSSGLKKLLKETE